MSYEITDKRLELFKKDYLLNIFLYKVQSMVCIKFWCLVFACMYIKAYNRKCVLILRMGHNTELRLYFDFYQHKQLIITFSLSAVFSKLKMKRQHFCRVSVFINVFNYDKVKMNNHSTEHEWNMAIFGRLLDYPYDPKNHFLQL